jgi:hypothetical protein
MKVGDLVRGKTFGAYAYLAWNPRELGIVTEVRECYGSQDVTVRFQDGEAILMEMTALKEIFEVVSPAP